jgi:HAD superfamily hydrolase (TIGR01509 family)
MAKAVIFDMDGVLADSEPAHVAVEQRILEQYGIKLDDAELSMYKGVTEKFFWTDIIKKNKLNVNYLELSNKKRELFFKAAEGITAFEGVGEILRAIKSEGLLTAVASSSQRDVVEYILMRLNIKQYFDEIVSGNDVINGKPAPDIFLKTAGILSVNAGDCLVIEDSINGILAAKNARMRCIAVTNSFSRKELSKADIILDTLKELDIKTIKEM